jgi:hypothetical protein
MALRAEGSTNSRSLVPALTGLCALVVGLGIVLIEGSRTDAVVSIAAVVLIGTLVQGALAAERAMVAAVRAGHVRQARSSLRLAMAMAGVTALALGVAVLGVRAALGTREFAAAFMLVLGAGVLNLLCGLLSARYAATVERHLP